MEVFSSCCNSSCLIHNYNTVTIKYWNTSVRNKSFGARFIMHFTLHVSAPIGGHLQVVYKHVKIYSRQSLYIQRIRSVGTYLGKCRGHVNI
jgi:hypothetical protein